MAGFFFMRRCASAPAAAEDDAADGIADARQAHSANCVLLEKTLEHMATIQDKAFPPLLKAFFKAFMYCLRCCFVL